MSAALYPGKNERARSHTQEKAKYQLPRKAKQKGRGRKEKKEAQQSTEEHGAATKINKK